MRVDLCALLLSAVLLAAPARVVSGTMESQLLGKSMDYRVFLPDVPPAAGDRYPVVYFLPGLFSNSHRWFDRGGLQIAEDLIASGSAQPFAVVVPEADNSFYINTTGEHGRYEDYFIHEVIPTMEARYPLRTDRGGRGLSGTSMGGYGAIKIGLKYPALFGSVAAHSAFLLPVPLEQIPDSYKHSWGYRAFTRVFGDPPSTELWNANDPWKLLKLHPAAAYPALYFDVGTEDRYHFYDGAKVLDAKLSAAGIKHEFHLYPGPHGWDYLRTVLDKSMLFHDAHFRKHPPESTPASGQ